MGVPPGGPPCVRRERNSSPGAPDWWVRSRTKTRTRGDLAQVAVSLGRVGTRLVKKPETGLTAEFAAPLSLEHQLACRSFITHTRHPLRAEEVQLEGLLPGRP